MNEEQWNAAIFDAFFGEDQDGREVYLCPDDETLREIGAENGLDQDAAVADFEEAVQAESRKGRDPFPYWRFGLSQWEKQGRPVPPPFIALLGATVLAATRRVSVGGAGRPPYYAQLTQILGLNTDWSQDKYRKFIPELWGELTDWLVDKHGGMLGLPTASTWDHFEQHIGFSNSQALLTGSERAELHQFFRDAGFEPRQVVEPRELAARLRQWSRIAGQGSRKLADRAYDDELGSHVRNVIASELKHWDGSVRTREGHRVLELKLLLDMRRNSMGVALRLVDDNRPEALVIGGERYETAEATGQFLPLPLAVDANLLNVGTRLVDAQQKMRMVFRPRDVIPFTFDEQIGRWVSTTRAALESPHCVLVRDDPIAEVRALMKELRSDEPSITRKVAVPAGWTLLKGFTPRIALLRVDPALAALVPAASEQPSLAGGLRVVSGLSTYLVGGAPDLIVPGLGIKINVSVDDAIVEEVGEDGLILPLQELQLRSGEHTVSVGSWTRGLTLVREVVERPLCEPTIGHHLISTSAGIVATGPATEITALSREGGEPIIAGAAVELGATGAAPAYATMIKAQATRGYWAFGQPGEVVEFHPEQPEWARVIGLSFNSFEAEVYQVDLGLDFLFVARRFIQSTKIVGVGRASMLAASGDASSIASWAAVVSELATSERLSFSSASCEMRWNEYAEIALAVFGDECSDE